MMNEPLPNPPEHRPLPENQAMELGQQAKDIMYSRIRAEVQTAKLKLLEHLIEIAQQTTGAEVWRALFAEMHKLTDEGF